MDDHRQHRPSRSARVLLVGALSALLAGAPASANAAQPGSTPPPTDCTATVGMPQQGPLPGYAVTDADGSRVCVGVAPSPTAPTGAPRDWAVTAFTDRALRETYRTCHAQGSCAADATLDAYVPTTFRSTGRVDPVGAIDPYASGVPLRAIRRPAYFTHERISHADKAARTIEVTVPAERYDREHGHPEDVALRGWYLQGRGVADAHGRRHRALVVLVAGRTVETTAAQDLADPQYERSADGRWSAVTYPHPGSRTEAWGAAQWRGYLEAMSAAGYDVVTLDKRGHGISGGRTADNTFQQGLDMLRTIDQLRSGRGLRTLAADGRERRGASASREIASRREWDRMPIVLGGSSQGSYTTQWAMHANLERWCEVDQPSPAPCHRPWGDRRVRGAILLSALPGFPPGTEPAAALEGGRRERLGLVRSPSTEPLAGIRRWPAVYLAKGTTDDVSGPAATVDAYLRARPGHRQLQLVRGPHSEVAWGSDIMALVQRQMVAFAGEAIAHRPVTAPVYRDLREAVAGSPPWYAPTTVPTSLP